MADEGGGGGGFTGLFREHPLIMAISVVVIALIAYMASKSGGSGSGTTVIAQPAADPNASNNAAAITEANIAAGSANVGTAASLIGEESTNAAGLRSNLAQIEGSRQVGLAQIEADLAASEAQTAAAVTISGQQTSAQLEAARITAQSQAAANAGTNSAQGSTTAAPNPSNLPPSLAGGGIAAVGNFNAANPGANPNPNAAAAQAQGQAWIDQKTAQIKQAQQDSTNLAKKIFAWAVSWL